MALSGAAHTTVLTGRVQAKIPHGSPTGMRWKAPLSIALVGIFYHGPALTEVFSLSLDDLQGIF